MFDVIVTMIIYANISQKFKDHKDLDGNIIPPKKPLIYKAYGYLVTGIYSIFVILFGLGYKKLAKKITDNENHQY